LALSPEAGAGCGSSARPDLWRGLRATVISTPTFPGASTPGLVLAEPKGYTAFTLLHTLRAYLVVGVYFLQGRCGLLYRPLFSDDATWISEVSQEEFRRRVLERFGVRIMGITFD
jgi:hypothetical protein